MKFDFSGKGVFVFSDAAAANSVCAIVKQLIREGKRKTIDFLLLTNPVGILPMGFENIAERQKDSIGKIIEEFQPDFVFTGTTTSNDFEHRWRKEASARKIKTYAFIDHWNFYKARFFHNKELLYADQIWVINEAAWQEAVNDGIPVERLFISDNPYYEVVSEFQPAISKNAYYDTLGIDHGKQIVLFISDNISDFFGTVENNDSSLGFDEFTILKDVLEALRLIQENGTSLENFAFLIKLHPRCIPDKFEKIINSPEFSLIRPLVIKGMDALTVNYYADYVIGMFSNMVIEALLMNKKVLRVQIGQTAEDMFKFSKIKPPLILDRRMLEKQLGDFLSNSQTK